MASKSEKMSFESALERLEIISSELECGSVTLDKSLELYNEGIKLLKQCNQMLDSAEKKIKLAKTEESDA